MQTESIVALLIAERDNLNKAVLGPPGGRNGNGKPWKAEAPKKRIPSAAARRKMALGQKKQWAALKVAKG
jgi:hypothetical protein